VTRTFRLVFFCPHIRAKIHTK